MERLSVCNRIYANTGNTIALVIYVIFAIIIK